jgi:hypothetical protein
VQQGPNLILTWTGGAGTYQVQAATNLLAPDWRAVTGTLTATNALITPTNNPTFYRIVVQ